MSSYTKIVLNTEESALQINSALKIEAADKFGVMKRVSMYFRALSAGLKSINSMNVSRGAVSATASLTFADQIHAEETFVINGVTFTSKASGASGKEQFNLGADLAASLVNLAAKYNAHDSAKLTPITAVASATAVIFTVDEPGVSGNCATLSSSMTHVTVVDFASGSEGTSVSFS